jgi:adenylyl-sulfate kinase
MRAFAHAQGYGNRPDLADMTPFTPHAFWLFGLSGAGKSTLAEKLGASLRDRGIPVLMLDGDTLRAGLCAGLGFSDADRSENLRRAAEAARLGLLSNLCVIASFITPLEAQRQQIARIVGASQLSLVHVSAPLDVCRTRDVKGLYAKAKAGNVPLMTGISSAFETPAHPDFSLETNREPVEQSAQRLLEFTLRRLSLPR